MGRQRHSNKRKRTTSTAMPITDTDEAVTTTTALSTPAVNEQTTENSMAPTQQSDAKSPNPAGLSFSPTTTTTTSTPRVLQGPPLKRTKREEYRASVQGEEERVLGELPKKKFYRQRAHANPFSDHTLDYPISPSTMDWSSHFPAYVTNFRSNPGRLTKNIEVADVGCGFGGLLFALAPRMPDSLILGLEIRVSVTEFVQNKIRALRHQAANPPSKPSPDAPVIPPNTTYQNIATHRSNTMKFLPNFLPPRTLSALFLCFPDPHFKARKHKARIVSATLCAEYFWVVRPGGRVYTITDVEDLAGWMAEKFDAHPGFRRVEEAEWRGRSGGGEGEGAGKDGEEWGEGHDWKARLMMDETEEGKKVTRNGGKKFVGIWERMEAPAWPGEEISGS